MDPSKCLDFRLRELDIGENAFGAEGTNNILSAAPASLTRLSITGWIGIAT